MLTTVPQQDTGNLDQPQIVGGFFLVTHQNRPALRKPAQRALHHPTPRRITFLAHLIELLFADAPDVWDVIAFFREFSRGSLVITFVQAQILRRALGGLWRSTTMASSVASRSLKSGTFAPAITTARGPPSASTKRERFTPFFPLSVGLGPIWSPQNGPCP